MGLVGFWRDLGYWNVVIIWGRNEMWVKIGKLIGSL